MTKSTSAGMSCGRCHMLWLPGRGSGFLNFKFLVMVFFHSLPFLDSNGSTSHHGFPSHCPSLVNHWESESRYWNLSLFHILLEEALFPTYRPYPSPAQQQTPVSRKSDASFVARLTHMWAAWCLPQCFTLQSLPDHPSLLSCPLCFNKGLSVQR